MLKEVLAYLNNYFEDRRSAETGTFVISGRKLALPFPAGAVRFVYVRGSRYNDGFRPYPLNNLFDETFTGSVTPCHVPPELFDLVDTIEQWQAANPETGAFQSESFGGYSYTKAVVGGTMASWQSVFGKRLRRWKKV